MILKWADSPTKNSLRSTSVLLKNHRRVGSPRGHKTTKRICLQFRAQSYRDQSKKKHQGNISQARALSPRKKLKILMLKTMIWSVTLFRRSRARLRKTSLMICPNSINNGKNKITLMSYYINKILKMKYLAKHQIITILKISTRATLGILKKSSGKKMV